MASKPNPYAFPLKVKEYAAAPVPSMEEWETMWKAWDCVTTQMFPPEALMEQPISLRNPLKFYVGHIPTFEDIHLSRATGTALTEPSSYAQFFERGIDPDVDDPTQCHDHSELPTVWPDLEEMLDYREKVKLRIKSLYETGLAYKSRCVGRALWIGYEHEGLHLETFLYMSLLSPNIKPPPGVPRPNFEKMAKLAVARRVPNQWFNIPEQELTIGYEDPESDDGPNRYFAWDNEREPYDVRVAGFEAQARPVSVGEYVIYLVDAGRQDSFPATWVHMDTVTNTQVDDHAVKPLNGFLSSQPDGPLNESDLQSDGSLNGAQCNEHVARSLNGSSNNKVNGSLNGSDPHQSRHSEESVQSFIASHGIRTVWGPIPLAHALDWPATLCYNDASSYADWVGGGVRIPTMHEVRSIHEFADEQKKKRHGVETTTRSGGPANAKNKQMHTDPEAIFTDLTGANVGLQNFHPVSVTHRGGELCGLGDLGGAWEWTSSLFAPQPNFKPMDIYHGYSYDFMDEKHMAITGGSWALPPRISGRKSL
ncbi:DUF323 domain-containing protein [Pyricularia oryzae]|uniref:Sulfatase-modifying factor enzyme domain-containing protein n=1 Tax=Pyricularia oryzae TaxID=318829 RepID=A0A4P7NMF3_PYROR|nr:hypothetical protein MCOR26_010149 [Pyricularia oryzae]KAI6301343.1 hypothetical protein MCOR34_008994 [Pyricularia oryzae]KAI6334628.1 hypothetical protein MCOR28_009999 [Pyricularia oryzae]KAI6356078.1 hypothetical protein MCOR32_010064 [Pyricularia oryzae]KAI6454355.1 hypothetical protein MCOR15_008265 [Pyricularia oryzae]